ncbi:MAG: DUF3137 domain-containing protein [Myxococcaceae bacterium]|nr:DUF3137 domain-containing protein [Myxococcaceae bacterium]
MGWILGILGLLVLLAGVSLLRNVLLRRSQGRPAWKAFLEATGYRLEGLPSDDVVAHAHARAANPSFDDHLVTELNGRPLRFTAVTERHPPTQQAVLHARWTLELAEAPAWCLEVSDRKHTAPGALLKVALATAPEAGAPLPVKPPTDRDDFNARFEVFATDPDAARALLATPEVVDRLLALGTVSLAVLPGSVVFDDPAHSTLTAALAQLDRALLLKAPYAYLGPAAEVHQNVLALLGWLADALRGDAAAEPPLDSGHGGDGA